MPATRHGSAAAARLAARRQLRTQVLELHLRRRRRRENRACATHSSWRSRRVTPSPVSMCSSAAACLIISLEDDRDELRRRILAVLKHHGIERSELKGWLYYITTRGVRPAS